MLHELDKCGLEVLSQRPLKVFYDEINIGQYFADLFVEGSVIIELKAVKAIESSHLAQTLNYLKATRCRVGLLINFSPERIQVKRS